MKIRTEREVRTYRMNQPSQMFFYNKTPNWHILLTRWPEMLCVVTRPEEASIRHHQGDGVGTDGLSSLSGLPRRFR